MRRAVLALGSTLLVLSAGVAAEAKPAKAKKTAAPPPEVRVSAVRSGVELRSKAAEVGHLVAPGDRLITQAASAAELTFSNGTILLLEELTEVVLFGSAKARPARSKGRGKLANTTLVSGRLRVVVGQGASMTIATDATPVPIDGEAQVEVTGGVTKVLVYRGKAKLGAGKKAVEVAQGFSSSMAKRKKAGPPQPLPSAPEWVVPPPALTLSTEAVGDVAGKYAAGGGAGPAADRWHVQVARDEKFGDLVLDVRVAGTVTTLLAEKLPPGRYVSRVSAVAADGSEGPFGAAVRSVVASARLSRAAPKGPALVEVAPAGLRCGVDGAAPADGAGPTEVDPTKDHKLACEVGTASGQVSFAALEKPAPPPTPEPEPLLPISARVLASEPPPTVVSESPREAASVTHFEVGIAAGLATVDSGQAGPVAAADVSMARGVMGFGLRAGYERYSIPHDQIANVDLHKDVMTLGLAVEYRMLASSSWSPFFRLSPQLVFEYERLSPRSGTLAAWDGRIAANAAAGARFRAGPGDLRAEVGVRQAFDDPFELGAPALGWLTATLGYALRL